MAYTNENDDANENGNDTHYYLEDDNTNFTNLSPDKEVNVQFVFMAVLRPLTASLGVLGNVAVLMVLTRRQMSSATNCFLAALAVSDTLYLLLGIPEYFVESHARVTTSDGYRLFAGCYFIVRYALTHMLIATTCWLTMTVTVERCLRFFPWRSLDFSLKRAKVAVVAIFVASVVVNFSKFFDYVPINTPNAVAPTELMSSQAYDRATLIVDVLLTIFAPVVVMVVFNTFLLYRLFQHRRQMSRRSSTGGTVDVRHVGMVVFTVVLIFVLCYSLFLFLALRVAIHGRTETDSSFTRNLIHVSKLLMAVNSSVNFIVYMSINRHFRKRFIALVGSCCQRHCKCWGRRFHGVFCPVWFARSPSSTSESGDVFQTDVQNKKDTSSTTDTRVIGLSTTMV